MSSGSDSEEFYDAEDVTPARSSRKLKEPRVQDEAASGSARKKKTETPGVQVENVLEGKEAMLEGKGTQELKPEDQDLPSEPQEEELTHMTDLEKEITERKTAEVQKRRRKLEELRKRMQVEDDDVIHISPPDSQSSSVEGLYAVSKPSHPFRVIDCDAVSLPSTFSLGRAGRGLGSDSTSLREHSGVIVPVTENSGVSTVRGPGRGDRDSEDASAKEAETSESPSESSQMEEVADVPQSELLARKLQEPDLVASTKSSGIDVRSQEPQSLLSVPVAPPRKKRKNKVQIPNTLVPPGASLPPSEGKVDVPSPASTIEFLTKEFEHSLDIKSATKGQYVVKPQDEDKTKAEGPSQEELERVERERRELEMMETVSCDSWNSQLENMAAKTEKKKPSPEGTSERRKGSPDSTALAENYKTLTFSTEGADGMLQQMNLSIRTRTDSGKKMTDLEILEQVVVKNLDTGEEIPLSIAEDRLPQGINPLSLHIMRLTSEYVSNSSLDKERESDEESVDLKKGSIPLNEDPESKKKKTSLMKKRLGSAVKLAVGKAKSKLHEVSHVRHKEDAVDIPDDGMDRDQNLKMKAASSHKGPYDFDHLQFVQDLSGEHAGPVWCMKFSACGRLLATAGQDKVLRIWVLKDAYHYFLDMRTKYNTEIKVSPTPSQESLVSHHSTEDPLAAMSGDPESEEDCRAPFVRRPFCTYSGHTSDLLDVSWSKNYFILSSSMDKTVRLWHISRKECLCCFQHIDFVTAIAFHPRDDRYFISGSLDGKLRLWNIPDKKVALWNELDGQTKLITAANFCDNGKFAVVGSYDGRCIFYTTEQLKYHTQIHVRSTRGKNAKGRKISGIEPMPGEDKILVTSNDSRIRLYGLRDLYLSCKYKGYVNLSSQIRACFSHDGKYIVSGSENQCVYIWKTHHDYAKFSSARRDRNGYWEGVKAHNAVVTCAVFAPNPGIILRQIEKDSVKSEDPLLPPQTSTGSGYVLVSADFNGCIKVFLNKVKPKHSSLPASALV